VKHAHQELVVIYVEVDEHQHRNSTLTCELVQLNNIVACGLFQGPVVVVRYNPNPIILIAGSSRVARRKTS